MEDEGMKVNLERWEELVEINASSEFYDVEGFKRGKNALGWIELEEVGDVKGKDLLHLQCHFGMSTMSWARLGARAVGVDYSSKAIALARELASELAIDVRFVESNVYELDGKVDEEFDIIITSYGVLGWLPDLDAWARVIAKRLRPGGAFHLVEDHPVALTLDETFHQGFRPVVPYFDRKAMRFEEEGSYASEGKEVRNKVTYDWMHPLCDVINSLIGAGLRIEHLNEFPFSSFTIHPEMDRGDDGYYRFRDGSISMPMMYSIKATRPPG